MGEQSADHEWDFRSEAFAGNVDEHSERTCAVCARTPVRVELVCGRLKPGLDGSNPPLDLGKPGAMFGPGVFQEGVVVIERKRERGALVVQNSQVVVRSRVAG